MNQQFPVQCAWCGSQIGYSTVSDSHGVCHRCFEQLVGIPLLTEAQLDALPFGLIELDVHGKVLTYNAAEQALSGRAAAGVIGRNFFDEVAPCTSVADFRGRFADFVRGHVDPESFTFTFPFERGSVDVSVAFVRSEHDTAYVLIRAHDRSGAIV